MITPDERREIKRLANEMVQSQIALVFNPDDKQTKKEAAEDVAALTAYLSKLSTTPEPS